MVRKVAIGAAVAVAGLLLLSWSGLGSYVTTAVKNVRTSLKKDVPLEFEVQRVQNQVDQLVPDMKNNCKVIAEDMVDVENLRDDIATTKANLQHQKDTLQTMTTDLDSGAERISYGGQEYSRARISEKLNRDFESYKRCEGELKSKEQLLEAREQALDAAKDQLATMRQQKEDLEVQIAQLEAELKTVRLAESKSKVEFDDSRLAQCKASLADIRNRLNAEKNAVELEGQFANDNIPVEKKAKPTAELTKEVKTYLGDKSDDGNKGSMDKK